MKNLKNLKDRDRRYSGPLRKRKPGQPIFAQQVRRPMDYNGGAIFRLSDLDALRQQAYAAQRDPHSRLDKGQE